MKTLLIDSPMPTFGFSYWYHGPKAVEVKCLIIKLPWFQEKFLGETEHSARLRRQEGDCSAWSSMRKGRNQWHILFRDIAGQNKIIPVSFALGILQARKSRESKTLEMIQLAWTILWSDWEQEEGARFPGRWTKGLDSGAGEKKVRCRATARGLLSPLQVSQRSTKGTTECSQKIFSSHGHRCGRWKKISQDGVKWETMQEKEELSSTLWRTGITKPSLGLIVFLKLTFFLNILCKFMYLTKIWLAALKEKEIILKFSPVYKLL